MDDITAAKIIIRCLDLTSLNNNDNEAKIIKLCQRAQTPYGNVAAVCVYPKFVKLCNEVLPKNSNIAIATVINFPKAQDDISKVIADINSAKKLGANELDVVFPYKHFLDKDYTFCKTFIDEVVKETGKRHTLKIILETGELKTSRLISEATNLCLKRGVNFIKTSTGKTDISATPEAANTILETILSSKTNAGFKASGGIKTINDAKKYLILAKLIMGSKWLSQDHFRIGASSLLDDLIKVIERGY